LPSACGLWLLHAARVPADRRSRPGAFVPHRHRKVPDRGGHIVRLSLIICRPGCTQEGRMPILLVPFVALELQHGPEGNSSALVQVDVLLDHLRNAQVVERLTGTRWP
jgi:hypothetical protein